MPAPASDERDQGRRRHRNIEAARRRHVDRQSQGRDGEGEAQRLDQLFALEPDGLQVGHRGNDEHARRRRDRAGDGAGCRPQNRLALPRQREAHGKQPRQRIERQGAAQQRRSVARAHARHQSQPGPRPQAHRQHGRPQPPDERPQRGSRDHLPGVGQERRQDQEAGRLDGRHGDGQQSHGDGRQTEADHALDEAGQEKHRADEKRVLSSMESNVRTTDPAGNAEVPD